MNPLRSALLGTGLALALSACAEKPAATPDPRVANVKPIEKAEPEFKKPVRMNGRGAVTSISLERFFELQQSGKALTFDARPAVFHAIGHIPGAISLPKSNCDAHIAKREEQIKAALKEGKTLVVYCTSITCPDARAVANHLSGFGYPASIFSGGWDAWKEAGMPTE